MFISFYHVFQFNTYLLISCFVPRSFPYNYFLLYVAGSIDPSLCLWDIPTGVIEGHGGLMSLVKDHRGGAPCFVTQYVTLELRYGWSRNVPDPNFSRLPKSCYDQFHVEGFSLSCFHNTLIFTEISLCSSLQRVRAGVF